MAGEEQKVANDDLDNSDENEQPAGERWAPVGANDGDDFFGNESTYKYSHSMESLSWNTERLKILEEEQEMLNSSLIALTTHFAQVQFRLRQIVDAPTAEKEMLLKELEEFAFRGIPDVPSNLCVENRTTHSTTSLSHEQNARHTKYCDESIGNISSSSRTMAISLITDSEVETKMVLQRTKQRELIERLKSQLEDLEKYAYETGGAEPPQSVVLERQNLIINHLKEKLNFSIDDLCKLPLDDLRWQVDCAISRIVSPLKMKEQLVTQLKTQITDLERFINYLQGEVSPESLACTCACPVHINHTSTMHGKRSSTNRSTDEEVQTKTLHTIRKAVALLHMFALSQLGCSSDQGRRNTKKNSAHSWKDLRIRLDVAVQLVLNEITESNNDVLNENQYTSDSDSPTTQSGVKLTSAVRKHLATSIRDLLHHGLTSDDQVSSVVPFIACLPQRSTTAANTMHIWELILRYYEIKNGHRYNSSPAQKLSQSFNLDLAGGSTVSSKQSLLSAIGNIIASHTPYKRSYDSHFKAFICASLNVNKLVAWLKLILQSQHLLETYYAPWSYVVKTGFQDGFHTLDRLTNFKFDLPVDLAVRQFQNIKDAF